MDQIIDIAKRSLRTLWLNKYLWFFGFFVAAGSNTGGGSQSRSMSYPGGVEAVPFWVWLVLAVAVLVGLLLLTLHIISEAALIEGVADGEKGERLGIGRGLCHSRRHFFKVIALKLLLALVAGLSVAVLAVPLSLTHLSVLPTWLGVALTVPLVLVGLPWLLSVYFIYQYALRFAVLEDRSTIDAARHAQRFLHGRIALSIKLALLSLVGYICGGAAVVVAVAPVALVAGLAYLVGGVIPAIVTGLLMALPFVALLIGAVGTFRSSVWTLGFIYNQRVA